MLRINLSFAQIPTVQDCAGAIPICQNSYSTQNSYTGPGNYANELNINTTCMDAEKNSVWYTFTAQTSGNLSFIITPNNTAGSGDDYDWSVFDLTHATCSDIYNNPSLEISCNSWGDNAGFNGATGASTANGGTGNHNGPGTINGPPFNSDIQVIQGGTYVIVVDNWSSSQYGYNINFGASTAQIFDNVPPHISAITNTPSCGSNTLKFDFSENIKCTTIAACDLVLTGPGGPYTITNITGAGCASGGTQEKSFTITFSPAISTSGAFSLNLNASSCNSVTDLCGNVAPSGSLSFNISLFNTNTSSTPATCGAADGTASVTATGITGTPTYLWSSNPPQTTQTATGLQAGNYYVTVTNNSCSVVDTIIVSTNSNLTATLSNVINASCGMADGQASVTVTSGTSPFSYNWNTFPAQTNATATNLSSGNYSVTVSDASGCNLVLTTTISSGAGPSGTFTVVNSHCGHNDGSAVVTGTGGSGTYTYLWNNGNTTNTISNQLPGSYNITIDDGFCDTTLIVVIGNNPAPVAQFFYSPKPISISNPEATFTATGHSANWSWDFGDSTGIYSGQSVVHTFGHTGEYQITLIVSDNFGCADTLIETVIVYDIFAIYIPNCFTPDGDGLNDVFGPVGTSFDPDTYSMIIFNRWGNVVYETTDLIEPWNGGFYNSTSRESKVPGVYTYRIILAGMAYPEMLYVGKILLMK